MADFKTVWDSVLPKSDMPEAVFSLSEDAINGFLAAHRVYDHALYKRTETLTDASTGKVYFEVEIIVGGKKNTQPKNAKPLLIELFDSESSLASATLNKTLVYNYPGANSFRVSSVNHSPNALLTAQDINFYMKWPSSTGGSWETHVKGVNFEMEAFIELEEIDASEERSETEKPQTVLTIVPVALRVSQQSVVQIRKEVAKALALQNDEVCETKINDLVVSLFSFAATQVGPKLARSITLPVAEVGGFDAYPSFLSIKSKVITIGASLKPSAYTGSIVSQLSDQATNYERLLQQDVANAGGWEKVLFTEASLAQYSKVPDHEKLEKSSVLKLRPSAAIDKDLAKSQAYALEMKAEFQEIQATALSKIAASKPGAYKLAQSKVKAGMGVAISEYFLDTLVSRYGNISKSGETGTINLGLVKGKLGYRLEVGTPDIAISAAKGVTATVATDAWAGLLYAVREIYRCGWGWSSWKRAGVGIKGRPSLSLKTRRSSGVSFKADFSLSGMKLYTGVSLLDKLLAPLSKIFFRGFDAFLDGVALLLSFVVLPAKFSAKGMGTALSVSQAVTSQYSRQGGPTDSTNNYLMIVSTVEGRKA